MRTVSIGQRVQDDVGGEGSSILGQKAAASEAGMPVQTASAATTVVTRTGAQISAAFAATPAVGDSFELVIINLGAAGDIITMTAGDGNVTFVGSVTIDDPGADINSSGTFRFRNTGADTWIGYRVA